MNLSHILAKNETKQPTSTLEEKNSLQQKLNILYHTTSRLGIERNKVTRNKKTETEK